MPSLIPSSILAALLGFPVLVAALEVKVSAPDFTVSVPKLPAIDMRRDGPQSSGPPHMVGSDGVYQVEVSLSDARKAITPRECAGSGLRAILAQPNMPERDNIYRAPLSAKTFLVIYVIPDGQEQMLHAHLLSSAGDSHCTDAHISRLRKPGEDYDDWRKAFSDARIEDRKR